jgi:acyl-CoA synthetase (AMP-forming)/AMP-acid ligase II
MTTPGERPWLRDYGAVPASIGYPRVTLYEALAATAKRSPDAVAWDFFGTTENYRQLLASIDHAAAALASLGLRAGDRLLISMPTARAGVIAFYAANVIGVPDESQIERVQAVVVLKDPGQESEATAQQLIEFCRERLIKWSCPREVEFRRELPKTRVGKVDFKVLVAEHIAKAASTAPSSVPQEQGSDR